MKKKTYFVNGKEYRKLERDEIIEKGAMQSLYNDSYLFPIVNADGNTVGDRPKHFSVKRDFYNPILRYKYRLVIFNKDKVIMDIYEFPENKRKDGFSTNLRNFLFIVFERKPEGGKIEIDKLVDYVLSA